MPRKDYAGEVNPELLHEELESIPGMLTIEDFDGEPTRFAHYQMVLFPEQGTRIIVEDGIDDDFTQVDAVMGSHDKTKKSKLQKDRESKAVKKRNVLQKLGLTQDELESLLN